MNGDDCKDCVYLSDGATCKSYQKPITDIESCPFAGYCKACAAYWKDVKPGIWVYRGEEEE